MAEQEQISSKSLSRWNFPGGSSTVFFIDSWLYFAIVLLCFLSFNHPDILHTIACTSAMLNGHIADFYDTVGAAFGNSNYLPATYVVFSLWGIPLKLLGFFKTVAELEPVWLFFWFKVLTSVFFAGSAVVLYKICLEFSKDQRRAILACVLWVSSPVAIFSQFIFGQYDILSIFFMLLGLLYYVRGDLLRFSFWFSISVAFKYFPAFIFFPLLALKEKNIWKLAFYTALFSAPNLIQIAMFYHSPAFVTGVLGFGAAKRAVNTGLMLWPFICVYAYIVNFKHREPRDLYLYAKLGLASVVLIFSHLSPWHPQWFLILTPFIAILIAYSRDIKTMLFVDTVFSLGFFSHTFKAFPAAADTELFRLGLWGFLNPAFAATRKIYLLSSVGIYELGSKRNIFHIIIVALVVLIFASRNAIVKAVPEDAVQHSPYAIMRFRFYGVIGLFLVSVFYAYYRTLTL